MATVGCCYQSSSSILWGRWRELPTWWKVKDYLINHVTRCSIHNVLSLYCTNSSTSDYTEKLPEFKACCNESRSLSQKLRWWIKRVLSSQYASTVNYVAQPITLSTRDLHLNNATKWEKDSWSQLDPRYSADFFLIKMPHLLTQNWELYTAIQSTVVHWTKLNFNH